MKNPGNEYTLTATAAGIPTFRHVQTGETLHGQAGPWEEAWILYVDQSGLAHRTGRATVFDVGLGCAAQTLACREVFLSNPGLESLHVVSFDLEKRGISALRAHIDAFPYTARHVDFVTGMECADVWEERHEGRVFRWDFVGGDFRESIGRPQLAGGAQADVVFYDMFSPASHPFLWTLDVFLNLEKHLSPQAKVLTYSSATAVRAVLGATGLYVGLGVASGKKSKTTMAARRFEDLPDPLPASWILTFLSSHKAFQEEETREKRLLIQERLLLHPQFRE